VLVPASPREKSIPDRRSGHPVDTLHAVETVPVMSQSQEKKHLLRACAFGSTALLRVKVISSSRLSYWLRTTR
jgi:hypothetical protein